MPNTINLPIVIQDPNPVAATHEVAMPLSITYPDDDYAPIVIAQDPDPGDSKFVNVLSFLIGDVPNQPNAVLDLSTLIIDIDGVRFVSNGVGETSHASVSVQPIFGFKRIRVNVTPQKALSTGLHTVRLIIADESGNTLDYTFSFTQTLEPEFERFELVPTELDPEKIITVPQRTVWDAQLRQTCPHMLIREYHFPESDLQTVRLERPIASKSTVEVFLNGKKISPHKYLILLDNLSVEPFRKHKLEFINSFRSVTDVVEVTYATSQSNCPRCHTLGMLDDYRLDETQELAKVRNSAKLIQEVEKIIVTNLQSNFRFAWYGTSLVESIGDKQPLPSNATAMTIRREIIEALNRLSDIKREQIDEQNVSEEELIQEIQRVQVDVSPVDPTTFEVSVDLLVRGGNVVEINTIISSRQAFFLPREF